MIKLTQGANATYPGKAIWFSHRNVVTVRETNFETIIDTADGAAWEVTEQPEEVANLVELEEQVYLPRKVGT